MFEKQKITKNLKNKQHNFFMKKKLLKIFF